MEISDLSRWLLLLCERWSKLKDLCEVQKFQSHEVQPRLLVCGPQQSSLSSSPVVCGKQQHAGRRETLRNLRASFPSADRSIATQSLNFFDIESRSSLIEAREWTPELKQANERAKRWYELQVLAPSDRCRNVYNTSFRYQTRCSYNRQGWDRENSSAFIIFENFVSLKSRTGRECQPHTLSSTAHWNFMCFHKCLLQKAVAGVSRFGFSLSLASLCFASPPTSSKSSFSARLQLPHITQPTHRVNQHTTMIIEEKNDFENIKYFISGSWNI